MIITAIVAHSHQHYALLVSSLKQVDPGSGTGGYNSCENLVLLFRLSFLSFLLSLSFCFSHLSCLAPPGGRVRIDRGEGSADSLGICAADHGLQPPIPESGPWVYIICVRVAKGGGYDRGRQRRFQCICTAFPTVVLFLFDSVKILDRW